MFLCIYQDSNSAAISARRRLIALGVFFIVNEVIAGKDLIASSAI